MNLDSETRENDSNKQKGGTPLKNVEGPSEKWEMGRG